MIDGEIYDVVVTGAGSAGRTVAGWLSVTIGSPSAIAPSVEEC